MIGALNAELAPFDLAWVLKLHKEMFGKVWQWAGELRKVDLNLGVEWQLVETQLYSLLQNVSYWKNMTLMEQAARLHHGAVAIHPFQNGNGRWARMLANIWLKLHGSRPTIWPEESIGEASVIRDEYLVAIKAADKMDFAPLIALHEKHTMPDLE